MTVFRPDGGTRVIAFEGGVTTGPDADAEIAVERRGDLSIISIGGVERFVIVEVLVFGG